MEIQVLFKKNSVQILNSENREKVLYTIPKSQLASTGIEYGDNKISLWIYELSDKSWVQKYNLYELARIIQSIYPNNTIDWRHSFVIIERRFQIRRLFEKCGYKNSTVMGSQGLFDNYIAYLEFISFFKEKVNENDIELMVDSELKKYNLA